MEKNKQADSKSILESIAGIFTQIKKLMGEIKERKTALAACRAGTEAARKSRLEAENNGDKKLHEAAFDRIAASLEKEKGLVESFEEFKTDIADLKEQYSVLRKTQYPELVKILDETKRIYDIQRREVPELLTQLQNLLAQIFAVETAITTKESPAMDDQAE